MERPSAVFRCRSNAQVVLMLVVIAVLIRDSFLDYPCLRDRTTTAVSIESSKTTDLSKANTSSETITTLTRPSTEQQSFNQKVLLFITTFDSEAHFDFLRTCWPPSIAKSPLLQKADVLVFSSGHDFYFGKTRNISLIEATFPGQNISVQIRQNIGYQHGAILALEEALKNKWFNGYDWVIRLNPDVIIRNDTWIQKTMNDPNIDGIFVKCFDWSDPRNKTLKVHTDFSIFRPAALSLSNILSPPYYRYLNAESVFREKVAPILESGRYKDLEGPEWSGRHCKVRGRNSPVLHEHDYLHLCKLDLAGHAKW